MDRGASHESSVAPPGRMYLVPHLLGNNFFILRKGVHGGRDPPSTKSPPPVRWREVAATFGTRGHAWHQVRLLDEAASGAHPCLAEKHCPSPRARPQPAESNGDHEKIRMNHVETQTWKSEDRKTRKSENETALQFGTARGGVPLDVPGAPVVCSDPFRSFEAPAGRSVGRVDVPQGVPGCWSIPRYSRAVFDYKELFGTIRSRGPPLDSGGLQGEVKVQNRGGPERPSTWKCRKTQK